MSENTTPLVSVVMPVYNCEPYLEMAVNSILNQSYKNLELIAVDDGSSDKSWEILQRMSAKDARLKPFKNATNMKIVATLNTAVAKAKGKYIARMDGDDEKVPDAIAHQVAYLEANPAVVIVGGAINVCGPDLQPINRRPYPQTDQEIRKKLFRFNTFAHPAVMMRADALARLGARPYQSNWAEDYDLWFRLGGVGKMANLSEVVLNLRTHPQSVSRSKTAYQEKLTLYLRLKAVFEYGYVMTAFDKLYFATQLLTSYMMPATFRFWLFNKIRSGLLK